MEPSADDNSIQPQPCLVPILDSTSGSLPPISSSESLPSVITSNPSQVYSHRRRSSAPRQPSTPDSGISPIPLASNIAHDIVPP